MAQHTAPFTYLNQIVDLCSYIGIEIRERKVALEENTFPDASQMLLQKGDEEPAILLCKVSGRLIPLDVSKCQTYRPQLVRGQFSTDHSQ